MCCENELVKSKFKELDDFIESLENKNGSLIEVLHRAQSIFGYIPKEVQLHIAEKLQVPVSKVYGIITFYSYFNIEPKGDYVVSVCMGTACFVRGASDIVEEFEKKLNIKVGETTNDNRFTLDILRCVGACGLAPVVTINDKVYGHVTKDKVDSLLANYLK